MKNEREFEGAMSGRVVCGEVEHANEGLIQKIGEPISSNPPNAYVPEYARIRILTEEETNR